jgi:hypothetical protein
MRPVLLMFIALLALGLGYLAATGAAAGDIGAEMPHLTGNRSSLKPGAVETR